jgi:steroid 5-alpha reductase family enzyme
VSLVAIWLTGLAAAAALMSVVWVASVVRRDASLVDRVWGLAFVVLAWTYWAVGAAPGTRPGLALALVTVWGLRLTAFITWRNWGHGEDPRYAAMRAQRPGTFAGRSLVTVFLLQAVLAWLISAPLLAAVAVAGGPLGVLDAVAVGLWVVGFVFEAGGDWQLSRFRADPANRGRVMDRGLWRWTRHPNYFGDTVVWWSFLALGLAVGAWWSVAGTLLMTFLIVRVSGVALTDRRMARSSSPREGYEEYVRRTNAFFPGPRRRA